MADDTTPAEDAALPSDYQPAKKVRNAIAAALEVWYWGGFSHGILAGLAAGVALGAGATVVIFLTRPRG